jgi:SAM-dependent methyltransferase
MKLEVLLGGFSVLLSKPWVDEGIASASAPEPGSAYWRLRDPKVPRHIAHQPGCEKRISEGLARAGVPVRDYAIDVADYRLYLGDARYRIDYPDYYPSVLSEKSLEHYVAAKLLRLLPGDVYVDIASEHSPAPDIYRRLFGVRAYRQDMAYPSGRNGDRIGGSATEVALPDGFVTKMALHCSFEHFEREADIEFLREVERLLKPGGAVVIVPLYLAEEYGILTDPEVAVRENVPFENGVTLYAFTQWNNRHGRFYDPAHFALRLHENRGGLELTVYRLLNFQEVDPSCYARFALLLQKPDLR